MQCIVYLRFLYTCMFQLCDPCFKAVKLQKVEVEEEQAPITETVKPTSTPTTSTNSCSLMMFASFIIFMLFAMIVGMVEKLAGK